MTVGENIIVMCLLSGLLMLDKYSLGEFGISQPLVSASIIGFSAGSFLPGVILGVLLQPVWLIELPIGRKVPLDAQGAGISGAVAFFTLKLIADPRFEVCAFIALIVAGAASIWGGWLDKLARQMNGKLVKKLEHIRNRRKLMFVHFAALNITFVRGVLMAALAVAVAIAVLPLIEAGLVPVIARERLLIATLSIGLASGLMLFGIKQRIIPFLVGFAAWIILWVFIRF